MTERYSSFVDRTFRLQDGRTLGYAEYGDPEGIPVLYFHGTLGSRLDGRILHAGALQRRVRLVVPDRPGFGLSDFGGGRALVDWPDDVSALADGLDLPRFSILATTGGSPYALACAARIPERVLGTSAVNSFVPGGMRVFARDMPIAMRMTMAVLPRYAPWLLPPILRRAADLADRDPQRLLDEIAASVQSEDRGLLAMPEIAEAFFDTSYEAFRSGVDGAVWELQLLVRPWGFEPEEIPGPVHLFHGEQNHTVPAEHVRELAQRIPKCSARFYPDRGQLLYPALADALEGMVRERREIPGR